MKKIFMTGWFAAAALMLVMASGCINIEYVGQSFPALPADDPIAFFTKKSPLPESGYRSIGRVYLVAPPKSSESDILTELGKCAREHGANAVEIVDYKTVRIGMSAPDANMVFSPNYNTLGRDAAGGYIWKDSFGEPAKLSQPATFSEIRIKARLLVTDERYQQLAKAAGKAVSAAENGSKAVPAATAEEAADGAAKRRELTPAELKKPAAAPEHKPTKIDLTDDRNSPVAL